MLTKLPNKVELKALTEEELAEITQAFHLCFSQEGAKHSLWLFRTKFYEDGEEKGPNPYHDYRINLYIELDKSMSMWRGYNALVDMWHLLQKNLGRYIIDIVEYHPDDLAPIYDEAERARVKQESLQLA